MKFNKFFLLILILSLHIGKVSSQNLTGLVLDADNHAPIPFVTIMYDIEKQLGTISNIDGYFTIPASYSKGVFIRFNCMSYVDTTVFVDSSQQDIYLNKEKFVIPEVVIYPRENPAFAILRQVHKHKKSNNPENISEFECNEYSQTTLLFDVSDVDTSSSKGMQSIAKQFQDEDALFFEAFYHRTYSINKKHHLRIEATRFPGMKEVPLYLPNDIVQPFHFYNDNVLLGDKQYLNPLGDKNFSRYRFHLKDSLIIDDVKSYIIDYYPKSELRYNALKGTLVISSYKWAIKSVTAEPFRMDNLGVSILQNYTLVDDHWFPMELNYEMRYMGALKMDIPPFSYIGKTYISDAMIAPSNEAVNATNKIEVVDNAAGHDSLYWEVTRPVKLTQRQIKTFTSIDTVVDFDRIPFITEKLIEYKLPLSIVDIDLTKFYSKNDFEGHRIGLGLASNERMTQRFSIGGFLLYGTEDEEFKYGGDLKFNISKRTNFKTYLSYNNSYLKDDYFQDGPLSDGNVFSGQSIYNQDFLTEYKWGFKNTLKRFDIDYYVTSQRYLTHSDIPYLNGVTEDIFAAGFYASFDYYKKNMRSWVSPYKSLNAASVADNRYIPNVNIILEHGFKFDKYVYDYTKVQIEIESTFHLTKLGQLHYSLQSGKIWHDIPISKTFRGGSMYAQNANLLYEDAFQTVAQNEFSHAEYVYLFVNYKFGSLNFKSRCFAPQFVLYQNLGLGDDSDSYIFDDSQAMNQLLLESGIGVENIFRLPIYNIFYLGGGAAAFCRYGKHALDGGIQENIAVKGILSFTF